MRKLIIGAIISTLSFGSFGVALSNQAKWLGSGMWDPSDYTLAVFFLVAVGVIGLFFLLWGLFDVIRRF